MIPEAANVTQSAPATDPPVAEAPAKRTFAARKRSEDEGQRARLSAAFRRRVKASPALVKNAALRALQRSGGRGPAMVQALQIELQRDHGIKLKDVSLRGVLADLTEAGVLKRKRSGKVSHYSAGIEPRTVKKSPPGAAPVKQADVGSATRQTPQSTNLPLAELKAMADVYATLVQIGQPERVRVLNWAFQKFDAAAAALPAAAPPETPPSEAEPSDPTSLMAFMAQHNPKTDVDRVVCLGAWLTERGRPQFVTRTLTNANNTTAGRHFSNTSVAVKNAVERKLLARTGDKLRLTAAGRARVKALLNAHHTG